jgi:hypothetical protein
MKITNISKDNKTYFGSKRNRDCLEDVFVAPRPRVDEKECRGRQQGYEVDQTGRGPFLELNRSVFGVVIKRTNKIDVNVLRMGQSLPTLVGGSNFERRLAVSKYMVSKVAVAGAPTGRSSLMVGVDRYRCKHGLRDIESRKQGSARKSPVWRTAPLSPSIRNLGEKSIKCFGIGSVNTNMTAPGQ